MMSGSFVLSKIMFYSKKYLSYKLGK